MKIDDKPASGYLSGSNPLQSIRDYAAKCFQGCPAYTPERTRSPYDVCRPHPKPDSNSLLCIRRNQRARKCEIIMRIERKSILGLGVLPMCFGPHSNFRIQSRGDWI